MGYFAQFSAAIAFYLAMTLTKRRHVVLAYSALLVAILGCLSTGSRATIFGLLLQSALMIGLSPQIRGRIAQRFTPILGACFLGVLGIYCFGSEQLNAFLERTQQVSDDTAWRVSDALTEWLDVLFEEPLGAGVGSGHQQAALFLGGESGFGGYKALPESELSRVAMELGVLGFTVFISFRILCYLYGWMIVRRASRGDCEALAALALSTMVVLVAGGIYSPMANASFWFSLGVMNLVRVARVDADSLRFNEGEA
jgi:hypothetical protein